MHEPKSSSSRSRTFKLALFALVVTCVATTMLIGVPASREAARAVAASWRCVGLESGTIQPAEGPFFAPVAPEPSDDPNLAAIHYVAGDGFLGPGDDAFTGLVERDTLNPPLMDGEKVSFDGSGDDLRITRDC